MATLCLYISVMLPFIGAFGQDLKPSARDNFTLVDQIINSFFVFDIFLNFRTAYAVDDGIYVTDAKSIALNYLRSWFAVDLLSSFPFDLASSGQMIDLQAAKLLKLSKLARVLRVSKTVHIDFADLSDAFDDWMQGKLIQQLTRRGSVFIKAILLCHWLACGLKLVDTGILSEYVPNGPVWQVYVAALYWSMTTLTTVGYGDMIPTSDQERGYTTIAMVIGGGFYGYIVGTITSMVSNDDLNAAAYYDRMDLIKAWLDHHRLPKMKKRIIRRYFQAYLKEKSAVSEGEIWNDLSPELQKEVGSYIVHENVMCNPLFDGMPQGNVVKLQAILRRVTIMAGYRVTHAGEGGTAMYIILHGKVNKETNDGPCLMGPGESFGEEIVLGISESYDYTTTVVEKTMLEMLLEDEFLNLFSAMPQVVDRMRANTFLMHPDWKERFDEQGN